MTRQPPGLAADGTTAPDVAQPRFAEFARLLTDWLGIEGRDFPWRKTTVPYRVFVAECMLQQTDAARVVPVYEAFLERYPTPESAASAPDSEVLQVIETLGLRRRAVRLKRGIELIAQRHGGAVPGTMAELLRVPGVGPYTATAVLVHAFGADLAAVDSNVLRVVGRVFGMSAATTRPYKDRKLWRRLDGLIPPGTGRELNLAILDLAAIVCRTRAPRCCACPVRSLCAYHRVEA